MSTAQVLAELRILEACQIAIPIIAITAFLARVYVRIRFLRRFGMDDCFMAAAAAMHVADCAIGLVLTARQRSLYDGHLDHLTQRLLDIQTLVRLDNTFYVLSVILVKISLGFFFLHIFDINQQVQRSIIYTMVLLSTLSGIVWIAMIEGTCGIEIAYQSRCSIATAFNDVSIFWSILNAATDLVFTALSVNALWGTHFTRYVKVSAMMLLALACVGGAASIVRAVIIVEPDSNQVVQVLKIGRWSTIEGGVYITTGSLVTLRPLLQRAWQAAAGTAYGDGLADYGPTRAVAVTAKSSAAKRNANNTGVVVTLNEVPEEEET